MVREVTDGLAGVMREGQRRLEAEVAHVLTQRPPAEAPSDSSERRKVVVRRRKTGAVQEDLTEPPVQTGP